MNKKSLSQFLSNQINRNSKVLQEYTQTNTGKPLAQRGKFDQLTKKIDQFLEDKKELRIVTMPGLRGVGKTTLLAQLYFTYQNSPADVFYFSVDQLIALDFSLQDCLQELEQILGQPLEELDKKLVLLLDEVHYDPNWDLTLKTIADRYHKVMVIATGSSSVSLHENPDLARRSDMSQLFPMNFTEYQSLASKDKTNLEHNNLSKKIFQASNANKCKQLIENKLSEIKQYWINTDQLSVANFLQLSTLPLSLNIPSKEKTRLQVEDLIDKVIEKDLAQLKNFDSTTLRKIKKILIMTADSYKVSYTSLAKNLENISKETIIKIFNSLQEAEFLLKSAPLGSTYKKVRKQSRFHFMSPALRFTLLTTLHGDNTYQKFKGKLLEDIAALYLTKLIRRKTLTKPLMYDAASGGADFVVNYNLDEQIVLEIGFNKSSTKQIKQTMDKIEEKAKFGILVTNNKIDQLRVENNILILPLKIFLLLD